MFHRMVDVLSWLLVIVGFSTSNMPAEDRILEPARWPAPIAIEVEIDPGGVGQEEAPLPEIEIDPSGQFPDPLLLAEIEIDPNGLSQDPWFVGGDRNKT